MCELGTPTSNPLAAGLASRELSASRYQVTAQETEQGEGAEPTVLISPGSPVNRSL